MRFKKEAGKWARKMSAQETTYKTRLPMISKHFLEEPWPIGGLSWSAVFRLGMSVIVHFKDHVVIIVVVLLTST